MKLFDRIFKTSRKHQEVDLTNIVRTEHLEGISIPGIIQNVQYHFTNIDIYRDGLIFCWEMVDLPMFKDKLNKRWVVTSIPDGEAISIFNLGNWVIEKGNWTYDKTSFYNYVYSLVKRLNPTLENLHHYHGSNTEAMGKVQVAKHSRPDPKPYYDDKPGSMLSKRISGEKFYIFFRNDDHNTYLAELSIYQNGLVQITHLPAKKSYRFEDLKDLIAREQLATTLKPGEIVTITGLGSFTIRSGHGVPIDFKYNEFADRYKELNGQENSIARCARIFEAYKQNPTSQLKHELKNAYEAVPEHQRMFVGNMDTKDYEVRQILYGNGIKKEWEDHYGFEYPFDDMPKPIE